MKKQKLPKGFKVIKFNIYWIYGAIFLFFLLVQFFGSIQQNKLTGKNLIVKCYNLKKLKKL